MNKLTIIGNLTKDPELRTTVNGSQVCSFTVAVNRRKTQNNQQPEADFFNVAAWNQLGETCSKYLAKGRKVAVIGSVSIHTYQTQDGSTRASMNVLATEVEFLSRKDEETKSEQMTKQAEEVMTGKAPHQVGFTEVQVSEDDLPF